MTLYHTTLHYSILLYNFVPKLLSLSFLIDYISVDSTPPHYLDTLTHLTTWWEKQLFKVTKTPNNYAISSLCFIIIIF